MNQRKILILHLFFFCFQLLLQGRKGTVAQFRKLLVVTFTLCNLNLIVHIINFLTDLMKLLYRSLFILPLCHTVRVFLTQLCQLLLQGFQTFLTQPVIFLFQCGFLNFHLQNLTTKLIQFRRHGIQLCLNQRTGLIHQVNRFIRKETIRNITIRKNGSTDQCIVHDFHSVVYLITILQTTKNGNRILYGRFFYHNRLETTFQSRILFNILTVFIQCGRADTMKLTTGQHRLEHITGIKGSVCLACTDNRMQLINKQDDLTITVLHILKHSFQTLFKFTTILRTCNQCTHIQRKNLLIL